MDRIDLHRHLGGSISPETVWQIIQRQPELQKLAESVDHLYTQMTFRNDTNYNFQRFLRKFNILNHIKWDEEAIDLAVGQVISDIWRDQISYCELRFSISKYLIHLNWDEQEACLFVLDRINAHSQDLDIKIGPILSIKFEAPKIEAKRTSKLINHWRIAEQLSGLDFVGDEAFFQSKSDYLSDVCRYWRMCGKGLLCHAGESQSAENVRTAISKFRVNRVSHGIAAAEHLDILKLAVDNNIVFDIAVTSNIMTGVVKNVTDHPIKRMHAFGCLITIGTDDPVTFDTNLDKEYEIAASILGVDDPDTSWLIDDLKRNSAIYKLS